MNPVLKHSLSIKQTLIFNSFEVVGEWWNYQEVNSPFSRLYLITEGEGWVYINHQEFHLTPGKLFLIPKFTFHSYKCKESMGHYYFCFLDEMVGGTGMYDLLQFNNLVDAQKEDYELFRRLNELNPHRKILNPDPQTYDNKDTLYSFSQRIEEQKLSDIFETQGIMLQLTSRFIKDDFEEVHANIKSKKRLNKVTHYIDQNLNKKITLDDLANQACLSPDYLSKIFNEIMGIRPMEFINRKRIESSQMLLITTNFSISQVAEKVGVFNYSYFSTLFKKYTLMTPEAYQKMHNQI